MTVRDSARLLAHVAHAEGTTGQADANYALVREWVTVSLVVGNAAMIGALMVAHRPCRVLGIQFVPTETIPADPASLSYQARKNDGAAGPNVNISLKYDGTAVPATARVKNALTINTDGSRDLAAGDLLEIDVTKNAGGDSLGETLWVVEMELL